MVKRYKGGLMGSTEAITSIADARGVWGIVQATQSRNVGNWPGLLATETPGSGSGAGFSNGFMTVSNVAVTDSSYTVLDDTPNISTSGGYIRLTGRGFVSGCVVYVGGVAATSTTFVSSTEVRAQIAAATSNTLMVYVVNPDGSTGIKLSSLVFSGTPSWNTGATLSNQSTDVAFSVQFSATSDSAVTYAVASGSSLPPGTSLSSGGVFSGTVTGLSNDTTYSFAVNAIDAERQDTARTFSVTFAIGDQYFYLTPLLLNGEANVWIRDSSVNNLLPTIGGDTRPTAFSPYNYNQSVYFDGTGDYLSVASNAAFAFGTGDFTVECWVYITTLGTYGPFIQGDAVGSSTNDKWWFAYFSSNLVFNTHSSGGFTATTAWTPITNVWYHVAAVRQSGTMKLFINGTSGTVSTTGTPSGYSLSQGGVTIGAMSTPNYLTGYISNTRLVSGVAVYTGSFTVPTTKLANVQSSGTNISAITAGQTVLLTCQDARFVDNSSNAFTVTPNGDVSNRSFGPFVETDIVSGSAYFDGTGDYLTVADNAAMELGAGDFCVECWIYPTSVTLTAVVIDKRSGGFAPLLLWRSTSTLQLYMSLNGSSWGLASAVTVGTLSVNRWYHVAVFRVGSSLYTSFNGVVTLVTASGSGTLVNNATNWYIGTETNGSTNPWTGYIADMRFVVGSSVYTSSNFTPPASLLTTITNTQFLSLQYRTGENNHRFIDEAGPKSLIARNGNASQGSFSPHSPAGWSVYYAGTTDYLQVASTTFFNFGTGDFSFEVWGFAFSWPSVWRMITTAQPFTINGGSNGIAQIDLGSGAVSTGITLPLNTWFHFAVTRQSGTVRAFLNGVLSYTVANATNFSTTGVAYIGGIAGFTQSWNGYLSNMRVVNGSVPASYQTSSTTLSTTIFTPSTSALSLSSQGQSGATVFLTNHVNRFIDGNTTPLTITIGNTPKVQAFSPFRNSGTYSPATHGGSLYIDGSGDYLDYTSPVNLTLGTGDFTIEFWVYGLAAAAWWCFDCRPGGDGAYVLVYWDATSFVYYVNTGARITSTAINIVGQWTHVVVSRVSGSTRMFVNGTVQSTVYTDSTNFITPGASRPRIGLNGLNGLGPSTGYLSGLRVSTGLGVTSVTVPTAPPSFNANTALLSNFTNAGIVDATGRNTFETAGTARISNVASKFGIGSINFGTKTDYLAIPATPTIATLAGDFTLEAWVYPADATLSNAWGIVDARQTAGSAAAWMWDLDTFSSGWQVRFYNGTSYRSTGRVQAAVWTHVAIVRSGSTMTFYINGSSSGTATVSGTQAGATTNPIYIGTKDNATASIGTLGYIDDLRITNGIARTITLPTSAHLTK